MTRRLQMDEENPAAVFLYNDKVLTEELPWVILLKKILERQEIS